MFAGENGSGKSTLIKIISGVVKPDPGAEIIINGEKVKHLNPRESVEKGIQVIYQDLSLFPNLTVAENVAISDYYRGNIKMVNQKEMYKKAIKAMKKIDISINPKKTCQGAFCCPKTASCNLKSNSNGCRNSHHG